MDETVKKQKLDLLARLINWIVPYKSLDSWIESPYIYIRVNNTPSTKLQLNYNGDIILEDKVIYLNLSGDYKETISVLAGLCFKLSTDHLFKADSQSAYGYFSKTYNSLQELDKNNPRTIKGYNISYIDSKNKENKIKFFPSGAKLTDGPGYIKSIESYKIKDYIYINNWQVVNEIETIYE